MYLENRRCEEYLSGIKSFIAAAEADKLDRRMSAIFCPCIDCENVRKFPSSLHVHAHLIIQGFMSDNFYWNEHERRVLMIDTCRVVLWVKISLPVIKPLA